MPLLAFIVSAIQYDPKLAWSVIHEHGAFFCGNSVYQDVAHKVPEYRNQAANPL